jgi:transcriptional regulator with XRE-family HTH domain
MDVVRLGSVFRAVRIRLRLRQAEVARRAGVGRTSIGRIERGRTGSLSVETLMNVASSLEIQLDLIRTQRGCSKGAEALSERESSVIGARRQVLGARADR